MSRKARKMALLAKIETTYGTSAVPTGLANAILATQFNFTPMAGGEEARDLMLPYLGNQGVELTGEYGQLEFSVEVAGAGAAGDVPGYGALLRACAMSETVDPGVSVVYAPVSANEEAVTIFYNQDGVNHVLLGARGNVAMELSPNRIPRFRFTFMGLDGTISDTALPTVDVTAFQKPLSVSDSVTDFSLHGIAAPMQSCSLDLGNTVSPELLVNLEEIYFEDRQSSGQCVLDAQTLATVDWFGRAKNRTRGVLAIEHGTVAGNIVAFDAPSVEIGRPTQGETKGKITYTLPIMLVPVDGNDELTITVK
jgi:hypothetical protein